MIFEAIAVAVGAPRFLIVEADGDDVQRRQPEKLFRLGDAVVIAVEP
ncbi:MAG: hypothetical protein M3384_10085 [Acidobacteriota bacterium]|nr:hypothetical protein [Acidobacteriota bacterium]